MNKIIAFVLNMILVVSLTACGSQDNMLGSNDSISDKVEVASENKEVESEVIMQTGETKEIPSEYLTDANQEGTVVEIEYNTFLNK